MFLLIFLYGITRNKYDGVLWQAHKAITSWAHKANFICLISFCARFTLLDRRKIMQIHASVDQTTTCVWTWTSLIDTCIMHVLERQECMSPDRIKQFRARLSLRIATPPWSRTRSCKDVEGRGIQCPPKWSVDLEAQLQVIFSCWILPTLHIDFAKASYGSMLQSHDDKQA